MTCINKAAHERLPALRLPGLLDEFDIAVAGHNHRRAIEAAIALAAAVREVLRGAARDLDGIPARAPIA